MKNLMISLVSVFIFSNSYAADVICSCTGEEKCSDVQISFVPSNPGVYLTIEYAYGEKNIEGFANITRNSKDKSVIYKLENFLLVEKDNKYSLPGKLAKCN